jgi:hypothetical protein
MTAALRPSGGADEAGLCDLEGSGREGPMIGRPPLVGAPQSRAALRDWARPLR